MSKRFGSACVLLGMVFGSAAGVAAQVQTGIILLRAMHEEDAATLISRDRTGAYRYLPQSVVSFVTPEQVSEAMRAAGFGSITATPLTFGVVTVYIAHRP